MYPYHTVDANLRYMYRHTSNPSQKIEVRAKEVKSKRDDDILIGYASDGPIVLLSLPSIRGLVRMSFRNKNDDEKESRFSFKIVFSCFKMLKSSRMSLVDSTSHNDEHPYQQESRQPPVQQ
jgi:hypothetical protein